jgi:2-polyprenyl-6-methoxyphenol hydroxylase-like FAD-dependent oxidoreductase
MNGKTILVVGAGIAGPTLAYWLRAAGFEPTLVEQAPALRTGGYVIDFWGLGYDIADQMGLLADLDRVGYHVREVRIVNDRAGRVTGFGTQVFDELTNGRFVSLARSDLSRLLFDQVKDRSEVIFGDTVVGLDQDEDGVRVQFRRSPERRFDLVVGADGLHSEVRRLAFGPEPQFETPLGYVVAAFEVDGYRPRDPDTYIMYGLPGRMVGRFTLHDDRSLFLFIFASGNAPATLEQQKAMLRETYAYGQWECPRILEALDGASDLYFDSVSQIRMGSWSRGRIALTGDAAFCVSLLAGQGSALAMISAYVLAGELRKACGQHEVAFARYEALLRRYIERKQRGAERFATAFAPRTRAGLWFRNAVIEAFSIPGLAKAFVGRDIADALQLPDYPWLPPVTTPSAHGRPQL